MKKNESEALRELMQGESVPEQKGNGMTLEQMKALYFDADALQEPNYRLWQLNTKGGRYYYTFNPEGEPVFFPSVTTILRRVMPENKFLTDWKLSKGKEEAEAYTMERASYGTFIHGQLASLAAMGEYDLDGVRDALVEFVAREKLPAGFVDAHEDEAKADIVAFARWMWDYDVKPYAIEVALFSPSGGYAGMIDLACNLRIISRTEEAEKRAKAGDDEKKLAKIAEAAAQRIDAIVDFKTGKKGFYDEYAIQLELYRRMWNENFTRPIERIFNIAPKDWTRTAKKAVSYSFEEQTDNPVLNRVDLYLKLSALMQDEDKTIVQIGGKISLNNPGTECVKLYKLPELVKSWAAESPETAENGAQSDGVVNSPAEGFTPSKTGNSQEITE